MDLIADANGLFNCPEEIEGACDRPLVSLMRLVVKRSQNIKYRVAGLIALLTLIIYLVALQNDFVLWDDSLYVSGEKYTYLFIK